MNKKLVMFLCIFGLLFVSYKYGFSGNEGTISLNAPVTFPVGI